MNYITVYFIFQEANLFSHIGGILGLWLGFSVFSIIEFAEFATDLIIVSCMWLIKGRHWRLMTVVKEAPQGSKCDIKLDNSTSQEVPDVKEDVSNECSHPPVEEHSVTTTDRSNTCSLQVPALKNVESSDSTSPSEREVQPSTSNPHGIDLQTVTNLAVLPFSNSKKQKKNHKTNTDSQPSKMKTQKPKPNRCRFDRSAKPTGSKSSPLVPYTVTQRRVFTRVGTRISQAHSKTGSPEMCDHVHPLAFV